MVLANVLVNSPDQEVTATLSLQNLINCPVGYKFKSTEPVRYEIVPYIGLLPVGGKLDVKGRISFITIHTNDPTVILRISKKPATKREFTDRFKLLFFRAKQVPEPQKQKDWLRDRFTRGRVL